MSVDKSVKANIDRFSGRRSTHSTQRLYSISPFEGFADLYDQHRPVAPIEIVEILTQMIGLSPSGRKPDVVDIGSGTGLSTFLWNDHAASVVGVEPNNDMRSQATEEAESLKSKASRVRFVEGLCSATGLAAQCADIVTISQALHWMDPVETFKEVGRLLRPGGVLAAFDCDWPPTCDWRADVAYDDFMTRVETIEHTLASDVRKWNKHEHVARMKASGEFRFVKELCLHRREMGDADRYVGLALSQGNVESVLKSGISEEAIGVKALRDSVRKSIGDGTVPFWFSYRVRVAVK
jgi:SAM-dependent methyltransferase